MIHKIPIEDRPRERCLNEGPHTLSLKECLAIIIGSGPRGKGCIGIAESILYKCAHSKNGEQQLFHLLTANPLTILENIEGLGPAGKSRILATFEIAVRYAKFRLYSLQEQTAIKCTSVSQEEALSNISKNLYFETKEWFGFVPINKNGHAGATIIVEKGVKTHVNFDVCDFFSQVLLVRPVAIILLHNHPSGDLEPSSQDYELTKHLNLLLTQFNIKLLGHWILGPTGAHPIEKETYINQSSIEWS
ncbi:MAG: JAB domain-containing protein [Bdellovibrionota bacterium]